MDNMDNTIRNQYIKRIGNREITLERAYREIEKELEYNAEHEHLFRKGLFEEYIEAYNFIAHYIADTYCREKGR